MSQISFKKWSNFVIAAKHLEMEYPRGPGAPSKQKLKRRRELCKLYGADDRWFKKYENQLKTALENIKKYGPPVYESFDLTLEMINLSIEQAAETDETLSSTISSVISVGTIKDLPNGWNYDHMRLVNMDEIAAEVLNRRSNLLEVTATSSAFENSANNSMPNIEPPLPNDQSQNFESHSNRSLPNQTFDIPLPHALPQDFEPFPNNNLYQSGQDFDEIEPFEDSQRGNVIPLLDYAPPIDHPQDFEPYPNNNLLPNPDRSLQLDPTQNWETHPINFYHDGEDLNDPQQFEEARRRNVLPYVERENEPANNKIDRSFESFNLMFDKDVIEKRKAIELAKLERQKAKITGATMIENKCRKIEMEKLNLEEDELRQIRQIEGHPDIREMKMQLRKEEYAEKMAAIRNRHA